MTMAEYAHKKIVCGTQRALDLDIVSHRTRGWEVEREEKVPRGTASKKFTYIAYLRRMKLV